MVPLPRRLYKPYNTDDIFIGIIFYLEISLGRITDYCFFFWKSWKFLYTQYRFKGNGKGPNSAISTFPEFNRSSSTNNNGWTFVVYFNVFSIENSLRFYFKYTRVVADLQRTHGTLKNSAITVRNNGEINAAPSREKCIRLYMYYHNRRYSLQTVNNRLERNFLPIKLPNCSWCQLRFTMKNPSITLADRRRVRLLLVSISSFFTKIIKRC